MLCRVIWRVKYPEALLQEKLQWVMLPTGRKPVKE
jgi:hypothetical protein